MASDLLRYSLCRTPAGFDSAREKLKEKKVSEQELKAILATPVFQLEDLIPLSGAMELDAGWSLPQVLEAGLYAEKDAGRLVLIRRDGEIDLVSTAGDLRSNLLPRSWFGHLGSNLRQAQPPLAVPGDLTLGELVRIASAERELAWFLLVGEDQQPTAALSREDALRSIPVVQEEDTRPGSTLRSVTFGLMAQHSRSALYFWCPVGQRCFMPWQIQLGPSGQHVCPNGHEVERRNV